MAEAHNTIPDTLQQTAGTGIPFKTTRTRVLELSVKYKS